MFFCGKIYIQIHIQTYLYTYMRTNMYSNMFIPIHTSSEYVPPSSIERAKMSAVYTKTHLAPANNHVGNSSPQG